MDYVKLKTKLDDGHPVTGAFDADDQLAADQFNALNIINTQLAITAILKFLILDNVYSTDGDDTQDRSLWQRMKEVVALSAAPFEAVANPWGSSSIGNITEIRQIKTQTLFDLFTLSAQGGLTVNLTDSNFKNYLAGAQSAGCMSEAQETALLALDKGSYAAEIAAEIRYSKPLMAHHITTARAS